MNLEQLTLLERGGIQCQHYLLVGTLASRGQVIFEFSLYLLCVYTFPTGTPRRIDVDIHLVSTYFFFGVILMFEKSMLFPSTFFGVISMVEKSTLLSLTFFQCNFDVGKIHIFYMNFSRRNFDEQKFGCFSLSCKLVKTFDEVFICQ